MKLTEGIFNNIFNLIEKNSDNKSVSNRNKSLVNQLENKFDYEEHGGTPILGIKGIVIKCHGASTEKSIIKSIESAKILYNKKFPCI